MIIKPDWDTFKTKFKDNPQDYFEWFCYLLFCKKYNKPDGIFRFKNQSAIETELIKVGSDYIGWQAKFYDTSLTKRKDKIIDSLKRSKRDYPNITKLLFYTNQEWGQTKKNTSPQGLLEIEKKAQELGINLEWRQKSFFEQDFVSIKNAPIAKHFFCLEKSFIDLICEQKKHTEGILKEIRTNITYNQQPIEIDRTSEFEQLQNTSHKTIIITGEGGSGKTAVIKTLYETINEESAFYIFEANEFEIRHIDDFFHEFRFQEFIDGHNDFSNKTVVIDSAEKLLDLSNTRPFKEFYTTLNDNDWKIIFTVRLAYLRDIIDRFINIFNISSDTIDIALLSSNELSHISQKYNFKLPIDEKLLTLIKNPFYLNEYIQHYDFAKGMDYVKFKVILWDKNIKKGKPQREQVFIQIARMRANTGCFFINPQNCDSNILENELRRDGIIGYETAGYFITHDIYEEWALEKFIEQNHHGCSTTQELFEQIGTSLPVRRSFRKWLSEQLFLENSDINVLLEDIITGTNHEAFWKDEVIISILLSNYSEYFFSIFQNKLTENNFELLQKFSFLLRLACKEADNEAWVNLGINPAKSIPLAGIFTKPIGSGWENFIKFIFDNLSRFETPHYNFILPVLHDWSNKYKSGETTKLSGLIALKCYENYITDRTFNIERNKNLLNTIYYSVFEIKDELANIIETIIKEKWVSHRDPYYDLSIGILTKFQALSVAQSLPKSVIKLANLFWVETNNSAYSDRGNSQFAVSSNYELKYFPASAFQTPIFWMLEVASKETIDFIINFTNSSIEHLASQDTENSFPSSTIFWKDEKRKQFSTNTLWLIYRGESSAPYLLQSIHMALEKYLLEYGKNEKSDTLENCLFYILKKSNSVSLTAVVASIVLAFPKKTFNVAMLLFKTKDFIIFDKSRQFLDLKNVGNYFAISNPYDVFQTALNDERKKTNSHSHRKTSLEYLFLKYQIENSGKNEERKKHLWEILDNYYDELETDREVNESQNTWQCFLSRMDIRTLTPTITEINNEKFLSFQPTNIDSQLLKRNEVVRKELSDVSQYATLNLWADFKLKRDNEYKKYKIIPSEALEQVKKIISKPNSGNFDLLTRSTPSSVCLIILRDYSEEFSEEDRIFCRDVLIQEASKCTQKNHNPIKDDGCDIPLLSLSLLLANFPSQKNKIRFILLLSLINDQNSNYALNPYLNTVFSELWSNFPQDAESLSLCYALLKPKYNKIVEQQRQEFHSNRTPFTSKPAIPQEDPIQLLKTNNKPIFKKMMQDKISYNDVPDLSTLDLNTLGIFFLLLPSQITKHEHSEIAEQIVLIFHKALHSSDRNRSDFSYNLKMAFFDKLSVLVLNSSHREIDVLLTPFLTDFHDSEAVSNLIESIIKIEDKFNTYDNFWYVWNKFKKIICDFYSIEKQYSDINHIIKSFLFANSQWKDNAKNWNTLKPVDKFFFKDICETIGHSSSTLFSIAKLLHGIGSLYIDDGILWIASILRKNTSFHSKNIEENTVFYLENTLRQYVYKNLSEIKKNKPIRENILVILDFLTNQGSVTGYSLRESIL